MKELRQIRVVVRYDDEAGVWYVPESNLPGLHLEAESPNEIRQELLALIPLLLKKNATPVRSRPMDDHREVPLELIMQSKEYLSVGC